MTTSAEAKFSWFIPFLGALSALGPLSNDLFVPSLPLVASGLDAGGGAVQLTLSTLLLGLSLGALVYGPLSDQYGRKPVLAAGLAVYVVAAVLARAPASAFEQSEARFLGPATCSPTGGFGVRGPRNDRRLASVPSTHQPHLSFRRSAALYLRMLQSWRATEKSTVGTLVAGRRGGDRRIQSAKT